MEIKMICAFALLLTMSSVTVAAANEVSCEKIKDVDQLRTELRKKCSMNQNVAIDSLGYSLASPSDESVETISFAYNKKVEFLPVDVREVYPNLIVYDAAACAIKSISKENFAGLKNLQAIHLDGNRIERIEAQTFAGLSSLEEVYLCYNKIKFVDATAFVGLNKLQRVDLFENSCICEDFAISGSMTAMTEALLHKCAFNEISNVSS